jgi:Phycobilisome Linker polypeptide/CpcD/allophycocyanin linker domain
MAIASLGNSASLGLDAFEGSPIELRSNSTEDELQIVIRAVYKQILGNAHVLDSQRLESAESLLRNGDITVRGFVRLIAQSELYQEQFFNNSNQYRFIELNCKHLLGRAPLDQAEISQHVQTYNTGSYATDIDSYIDSDEYTENFGENVVPFPRSIRSQAGIKNVGFNRMFSLLRGSATSDSGQPARLISDLGSNLPSAIKSLAKGSGNSTSTSKRFRITVSQPGTVATFKRSNISYEVGYAQLSSKIKGIQRIGGKIISINEIA